MLEREDNFWTIIFPLIVRTYISQFYKIIIWTLCSLNQIQSHGPCYTLILPKRMIQPSGILEGGQLLHLFCGCKLWFVKMHHFGSSECFSNVLIKAALCLCLIFKGKHFRSTQIPHHCVSCDFVLPEDTLFPLCEGVKV